MPFISRRIPFRGRHLVSRLGRRRYAASLRPARPGADRSGLGANCGPDLVLCVAGYGMDPGWIELGVVVEGSYALPLLSGELFRA